MSPWYSTVFPIPKPYTRPRFVLASQRSVHFHPILPTFELKDVIEQDSSTKCSIIPPANMEEKMWVFQFLCKRVTKMSHAVSWGPFSSLTRRINALFFHFPIEKQRMLHFYILAQKNSTTQTAPGILTPYNILPEITSSNGRILNSLQHTWSRLQCCISSCLFSHARLTSCVKGTEI